MFECTIYKDDENNKKHRIICKKIFFYILIFVLILSTLFAIFTVIYAFYMSIQQGYYNYYYDSDYFITYLNWRRFRYEKDGSIKRHSRKSISYKVTNEQVKYKWCNRSIF